MSVQTQIDRISGNVAAALAAIADKGVTVPDGSTSDALAGDVSGVPLLEGSEREELENVMQLLLRKLMSLSFSTRMVNELTEARNASSGED